ncbi:uncharacterized protein LOC143143115 isoform X2 [Ptiloglossa arizonensis]|uniref:uncharacterized protein LOC143143115 isoform X2 n=1 Tax=Ptiloglossa arizonensis TaxID=3350558 RepID=UPI003F9F4EE0
MKYTDDDDNSPTSPRNHISITPQMIRLAIKRLQLRRVYVNANLISEYLRHSYPVNSNIKAFKEELNKKLDCAVYVGLIMKHAEDAYYLPTLRQEANRLSSAFAKFWEMYTNHNKSSVSKNRNQNKKCTFKRN